MYINTYTHYYLYNKIHKGFKTHTFICIKTTNKKHTPVTAEKHMKRLLTQFRIFSSIFSVVMSIICGLFFTLPHKTKFASVCFQTTDKKCASYTSDLHQFLSSICL